MNVQLPDGTIVQDVPDGTTRQQLADKLQRNGYKVPPEWLQPTAKPQQSGSWLDKALGAGEAGLSMASAIPAGIVGNVAGVARSLTGGKYGTQAGVEQGEDTAQRVANKLTYQPRTQAGKEDIAAIGNALGESKLEGLPVDAAVATAVGSAARPLSNAARAAGSATAENIGRVGQMAQRAAGAPVRAAASQISPETARLARQAYQMGIPLRPDMLFDNRYAKMFGQAMEHVPLSGSNAEIRQTAFNRAMIRSIGGNAQAATLTPDVFDDAMRRSGATIGRIVGRTNTPLDRQLNGRLGEISRNVNAYQTDDVAHAVNNYIEQVRDRAVNGRVPGAAMRSINTEIGNQIRTSQNGDLRHALGDLQETLQDAVGRQITGEDRTAWLTARRHYANGKTLTPLVAKSPEGDISPAQLMGAVTNTRAGKEAMARGRGGELGTAARVGQRFLKEPPSSGTAERNAVLRTLSAGAAGAAGATHPGTAAGVYGLANLYNRLGPAAARRLIDENNR